MQNKNISFEFYVTDGIMVDVDAEVEPGKLEDGSIEWQVVSLEAMLKGEAVDLSELCRCRMVGLTPHYDGLDDLAEAEALEKAEAGDF